MPIGTIWLPAHFSFKTILINKDQARRFSAALQHVLTSPGQARGWHTFLPIYQAAPHSVRRAIKDKIARALKTELATDSVAAFLSATFFSSADRDLSNLAVAAKSLLEMEPLDTDRIAAFMTYAWANLLQTVETHSSFVEAIHEAKFPELVQRLGTELTDACRHVFPPRAVKVVRRVAVVTTHMSGDGHAPTGLALDLAAQLIRSGMHAELFSCQEHAIINMPQLLGAGEKTLLPPTAPEQWGERIHLPLAVHIADVGFPLQRRWIDMAGKIAEFDPDLVLFIGLYSPLVAVLYQARPVIGISVHGVPAIATTDVSLQADPGICAVVAQSWSSLFPSSLMWHFPFRMNSPADYLPRPRSELGIPMDAIVLVTAGFRLESEICGEWAAKMIDVISNDSRLVWLLVGGAGTVPAALARVPAAQILALPKQPNIIAILKSCDIFLNPPRLGGGFSVAEAMAVALPVLAFAGADGGNKIGHAASNHSDEYFDQLAKLIAEPALRTETGKALQARFTATLDFKSCGPSLLAACTAAVSRFMDRQTR